MLLLTTLLLAGEWVLLEGELVVLLPVVLVVLLGLLALLLPLPKKELIFRILFEINDDIEGLLSRPPGPCSAFFLSLSRRSSNLDDSNIVRDDTMMA